MFSRRDALKLRHASLEAELATEMKRSLPDDVRVKSIKLAKLAIRDEIETIERRMRRRKRTFVPIPANDTGEIHLPIKMRVG